LEREFLVETATYTGVSAEEAKIREIELKQRQKFIESLRRLKAKGRMAIRLAHLRVLKGSPYDLELMDGDRLYIPPLNLVVNVIGAVYAPGSFIYNEKYGYKDYIKLAGGFTRYADKANIYILRADGSAQRVKGGVIVWDNTRERWEMTAFSKKVELYPGDTIVVPEKLERIPWLRKIKDITDILFKIAVTTGVVAKLY